MKSFYKQPYVIYHRSKGEEYSLFGGCTFRFTSTVSQSQSHDLLLHPHKLDLLFWWPRCEMVFDPFPVLLPHSPVWQNDVKLVH